MNPSIEAAAVIRPARAGHLHRQRGVVMFVALVVLIVMTLAGLAMLRQMGSGVSIAGNIAFKQGATALADAGIENGRAWLTTAGPLVNADVPANGYYATWGTDVDPTSAAWAPMWNAAPDVLATPVGTVRYLVQRLCVIPGPSIGPGQECSDSVPTSVGGESKGGGSAGETPFTRTPSPFYRITARVIGPRNTVSYTQVVMN